MTGPDSRIERNIDSERVGQPGSSDVVAPVPPEKPATGVSDTAVPVRARLNNRVIIEFAAMAVAIAAIAYLYFHH
ncbi:MAG: hypothetical protein ACRD4K_05550 [Candidatus Acidiferrales bacterium]